MATITSTEACASGRYINLGDDAADTSIAQTILVYAKQTAAPENGFGYFYGRVDSGTIFGHRFFTATLNSRLGFGGSSTGANDAPFSNGTVGGVLTGTWRHYGATWDGGLASADAINYFMDVGGTLVEDTDILAGPSGSGSSTSAAGKEVFLLNRKGLGRAFIGSVAYIARWNRVLSLAELQQAHTDGPLSVPSGLILCWANNQDYGPNAYTPVARSTFVAGELPPNTALGGSTAPVAFAGTVPAQSWVEDAAITPLDLSSYFSGDLTPFSYAVTTGTLPAGLSLNTGTGVISGTPTTPAAAVSIVVTATDADTNTAVTNAFDITITAAVVVIKGVQVTLYDGATEQASITGITARWWDSPTAAGAPLLKTDTASTDAAGLLELDIDSVTSLDVAGVGYLSLYKVGADAESDLHFASRLPVQDIA